ncbi:MAG: glycosyltransferase family 4 protein, partial [Bacteroidota bacterium]
MKILQLCNKFPFPPADGGAVATLGMTKSYARTNHQVTVLAINTSKHYFDPEKLPDDIKSLADFKSVYVNTDIKILPALLNLLFSGKPYNAIRFISKKFDQLLVESLRKENFDVVQLEGLYLCPYIKTIRKHSNALISYRAHNVEHEIWSRLLQRHDGWLKNLYVGLISRRIKRFEHSFLNKYDVLVPITRRDEEKLKSMGNRKPSFVCPMGIQFDDYKTCKIKPSANKIFHLGGLDWPPNQQGILWFIKNIWPALIQKNPSLIFYVGGRNAPGRLVRQLNSTPNLSYVGEVADAKTFMQDHGIMIVPLLSGSGMRIKILEGLALGKTIISTPIGAEGIEVVDGIHIIIAENESEFIEKTTDIIKNTKHQEELGQNARTVIQSTYNAEVITRNLIHFYEQNTGK